MNIRDFTRIYTKRDDRRAWAELGLTLVAYAGFILLGITNADSPWIAAPFAALAGLMAVRVFMIQHDCMHNAFFTSKALNDVVGEMVSPISLSPYVATRHNHNLHHAHVGNLDHREAFEIEIMTVEEYRRAPLWRRLWYRFYRSPFTLLVAGPFVLYLVLRRFPRNGIATGLGWVILHDAMVAGYFALVWWLAGWPGVLVLLGSIYVGATFGAIVPYVVHNFEQVYWGRQPDYSYEKGALRGSSVLRFGRLFDWLTLNIAYHDLHHLNANIPCYNLGRCYHASGDLLQSREIGFLEALRCYGWKLYDEHAQKMVGWQAARRGAMTPGMTAAE